MSKILHTSEPWEFRTIGNRIGFQHNDQWIVIGSMHSVLDFLSEANGKRIVACVNALSGIKNPEHFVSNAKNFKKQSEVFYKENESLQFKCNELENTNAQLNDALSAIHDALENGLSINPDSILHVGLKKILQNEKSV
jgi:hypothetical protein